jgi:RNA polymerase sigma-70 factor (ECF subfamily)
MCNEIDIPDLIARAEGGDNTAVRDFLGQFEHEVRIMVRGRLPKKLRGQFDSMDFVQSVWQSFFTDLRKNPREFDNIRHLRGFLAGVARNKVYEEHRKRTRTAKYALAREEPLYLKRGGQELPRVLASREPTPSQALQAGDRLAQLTAGCEPRDVQIITLRHEGLTFEEIASRTGLHERAVRRVIEQARARMEARGWH